ncbi:MAG: sodium:alanine symporter family protein [Clostridia bacterium]|nr:sodium:alanine symporter family protein [Clostridia bacterium]
MLILIVGTGIYLTIKMDWFQFRHFGYALKNTIGKVFKKGEKVEAGEGAITPIQAVTTALAATVGTGNIVGVTGAIALGGPGAVFWMELSALVGMCTKFCEVTLSIKYRERNEKGDWIGGPMYYIKNGLGKKWAWLGSVFAVLGALCAFGIGNMTQINSIATSITSAVTTVVPSTIGSEGIICLIIGIVMAVICALTYLGGIKRIGAVTEKLVPVMAIIYIVSALILIFINIGRFPEVIRQVFVGAFNPSAIVGGALGITLIEAAKRGVSRGVFSNEAGLGSAPIAHAAAETPGPVDQGLYGIFEVFADTTVICTMTALVILMSGTPIPYGENPGVALTNAAFSMVYGPGATIVVAIGISLFAASTILSWGLYGTRCAEFLFGTKAIKPYQIIFCLMVIVGATMNLGLAWDIADTLNALMAIPNLIALLALSPVVYKLVREYSAEHFNRDLKA